MSKRQDQAGLSDAELAAEVAAPLPKREAMSLLGSGLLGGLPSDGLTNDPSVSQIDTTGDAAPLPADTSLPADTPVTLPPGVTIPEEPTVAPGPVVR